MFSFILHVLYGNYLSDLILDWTITEKQLLETSLPNEEHSCCGCVQLSQELTLVLFHSRSAGFRAVLIL